MRILITGGAGFIGSHIADRYLTDGHEIAIIDDLSTGRWENIPEQIRWQSHYQMGILAENLEEYFKSFSPEVVSHHAAHANLRASVIDPIANANVNVLGTIRMLELSRKYGVKRFIFASTAGPIYGNMDMEDGDLPFGESDPVRPSCPYGAGKLAAEHYIRLYGDMYGLPYVIFRYANVYGPRQVPASEAGVVTIFAQAILNGERPTIFGDGTKTRDYVYVDDIVDANVLALAKGEMETFNLGNGFECSDQEIFDFVRDAIGTWVVPVYGEKRPGEIEHYRLENFLAWWNLGWEPKISTREGIRRTVEWCRGKKA